jgi:hypothetical protein
VFSSGAIPLMACLEHRDDLLPLLLNVPILCNTGNLVRILQYAFSSNNKKLADLTSEMPALVRVMDGSIPVMTHIAASFIKDACRRGWDIVVDNLLKGVDQLIKNDTTNAVNNDDDTADGGEFVVNMHLGTALRLAVIAGRVTTVRILLSDKRRRRLINPGNAHNMIIREALEMGHVDIAKELILDPRVNLRDYSSPQTSVLCCAIRTGQGQEFLQFLLGRLSLWPDTINQFNHAPIRLGIQYCNYDAVRLLVLHCPGLVLTRDEIMSIFSLIGGMVAFTDIAQRLIHDRRFGRVLSWSAC